MFQPRSGIITALVSVTYCFVLVVSTYICPSPIASFVPQLPYPYFAPMVSSVHLDVAYLLCLISYFPYTYSVLPPSVPCTSLPSACASSPLDYLGLVHVYLPLPLYVAPWGVSRRLCLIRASCEASTILTLSTSSISSFRSHSLFLCPAPSNPGSRAHTSKIGLKATH